MRFVAILLAWAATAAAAERADLPPLDAVQRVLDQDPSVTAGTARIDAARAEAEMLRRGPHEIVATGSYVRRSVDREGDFDEFDGTVQRAFRLPGKAALDRQAGAFGIAVAQNRQEDLRHQATTTLSDLWHDWLLASALVRLDGEAVASYRAELKGVQERERLRDASALEVEQVRSALALAETQLSESSGSRDQARAALATAFPGLPLPAEAPAMARPELPQQGLEELRQLVLARSHEIRAAVAEADRLAALGRRAQRDRIPDPSFGVRLFSERGGNERGAGVIASIPLGGGYRRASADQAVANASAARLDAERVRREIERMATGDMIAARSRLDAWTAAANAAEAAGAAADRAERGYKLGATDLAEMLLIRRQAIDARRAEARARAEALRATLKIQIDSHVIWAPAGDKD